MWVSGNAAAVCTNYKHVTDTEYKSLSEQTRTHCHVILILMFKKQLHASHTTFNGIAGAQIAYRNL